MTNRENQHRLDRLALKYLDAIECEDFDAIGALWEEAVDDADLDAMLHGLNDELLAAQDAGESLALDTAVLNAIATHMPGMEFVQPNYGPLTVAEVAEQLLRIPHAGLTSDDLRLNESLRKISEAVPEQLGISQVVAWGSRFGLAPEIYWQAFRRTAMQMRMQRESKDCFRMAARPTKPKPTEGQP